MSVIMSSKWFSHIKACLSVANPNSDQNTEDKLTKTRPILEMVHSINVNNWKVVRDAGLDDSQASCGLSYARYSHRGEAKKPIYDYIKTIAAHYSNSGYCFSFHVYTRDHTVLHMLLEV